MENQRLKERLEYLEMENEYLKKLDALVRLEEQQNDKKQNNNRVLICVYDKVCIIHARTINNRVGIVWRQIWLQTMPIS